MTDAQGELSIPFWIVLMAHAAIALGTLTGGWRIVHTVGCKITKLVPMGGFAAETAGAVTIFTSSLLGIPVSTTHVITGAIVGVGALRSKRAVRWDCREDRVGVDFNYPNGRWHSSAGLFIRIFVQGISGRNFWRRLLSG